MTEEEPAQATKTRVLKNSRAAEISRGIVQLMHRYTGRGPTKARTTLNTNIAAVVLGETLSRGELNLVDSNQGDAVLAMRRTYHSAIQSEARSLVEEITGRSVVSAMADIDLEADLAVFFFNFEPEPETGVVETAEAAE